MNNRFMSILLVAFILIPTIGLSTAWTEKQITLNTSDQYNPDIYSNYIVWQDARNGGSDIYLQNMANKVQTRVTKGVDAQMPSVSATKIVWQDYRNKNWDIYMYEIAKKKTTQITLNKANQFNPDTDGNYIVWEDTRNGKNEVFLQDLSTKKQTNIGSGYSPKISGTKIAYSNGDGQIKIYDIKTKKTTTAVSADNVGLCSFSGNTLLVADSFNAPVMYFIGINNAKVPTLPSRYTWLVNPRHYNNKIVYQDWNSDGSNSDIYMLTL